MNEPMWSEALLSKDKNYSAAEKAKIKELFEEQKALWMKRQEIRLAQVEGSFQPMTYKSIAQNYKSLSAKACFLKVKEMVKHFNKDIKKGGGKKIVLVNMPGSLVTDEQGNKYVINKHGDSQAI